MPVKMNPTSEIIANLGLNYNGRVHKFFTQTCAIHMDKYVPMDTGTLAETTIVNNQPTSNVTEDTITYTQPYAKYVYYGISKSGKPLKYQKDKHSYAGKHWDKRMWSAEGKKVIKEVQNYINRGG